MYPRNGRLPVLNAPIEVGSALSLRVIEDVVVATLVPFRNKLKVFPLLAAARWFQVFKTYAVLEINSTFQVVVPGLATNAGVFAVDLFVCSTHALLVPAPAFLATKGS